METSSNTVTSSFPRLSSGKKIRGSRNGDIDPNRLNNTLILRFRPLNYFHIIFTSDEAPDTADDSDEDLITSYIPGIGHPGANTSAHPIIRIGSPTTGNAVLPDNRPILGKYPTLYLGNNMDRIPTLSWGGGSTCLNRLLNWFTWL